MMHKRILGLLLLVAAFAMFLPASVYAKDTTEACDSYLEENKEKFDKKYGISIKYDVDNDQIVIGMNVPDKLKDIKKDIKFKITKIEEEYNNRTWNQQTIESNYITNGNSLTYNKDVRFKNILTGMVLYNVTLEADGFEDPDIASKCKNMEKVEWHVILSIETGGKPKMTIEEIEDLVDTTPIHSGVLDCTDYATKYSSSSFDYKFCRDKALAAASSSTKNVTFTSTKDTYAKMFSVPENFQCSAFDLVTGVSSDDSKYYVNTSYLTGTIEHTINGGDYVYNYGCGKKTVAATCKVKCEEVVTVEYGPPVASKAGLCFEYKVKVTSRVNCDMVQAPEAPKKEQGYCTPTPACVHASGWVYTQAGPNEEFDACINSCDGGKYTDRCATKCYNQIYGSSNDTEIVKEKTSNPDVQFADVVQKVYDYANIDASLANKGVGKYTCKNGVITWSPQSNPGRWYVENPITWKDSYRCVKNTSQGGGIVSVCTCSATCSWQGCTGEVYLNPGEAKADYEKNAKIYNDLKNKCTSYAKCNTTQAEFTINVDYTYGKDEKTTIYFPYSNNDSSVKDTIKYNEDTKSSSCTIKNDNSTILSSNGCYTCSSEGSAASSGQNWYQTEWSFPGTWIHNKTGEISYTPKTGKNWTSYNHKFCIPLDANNVNTKWWNYYYAQTYGNDSRFSYNDSNYLAGIKECASGTSTGVTCSYNASSFSNDDVKKIDYNIKAATRKFGMFEWNIDISCFYALNDDFPNCEGCSCENNCTNGNNSEEAMRVRSVDLTNLFPDADGTTLTSSNVTGRTPGFNWSQYATNTVKDPDFTSNPANYTKWVQAKGYSVYSDDYLDYEVILTKEDIKQLKDSSRNYTEFDGKVTTDSVTNYQSPLFRGSGAILNDSKFPTTQALKCNNMKNYTTSDCQEFENVGEVK